MIKRSTLAGILSLPILFTGLASPSSAGDSSPRSACNSFDIQFEMQVPSHQASFNPEVKQVSASQGPSLTPPEPYHGSLPEPAPNPNPEPTPEPVLDYNLQNQAQTQVLTPGQVRAYTHQVFTGLDFTFPLSRVETVRKKRIKFDPFGIANKVADKLFGTREEAVHTEGISFQQDGGMGHIDEIHELQNFANTLGPQYNPNHKVDPLNFERHCGALAIPPEYISIVEVGAYTDRASNLDRMVAIGTSGVNVMSYTGANGNQTYLGPTEAIRNHKVSGKGGCLLGGCK